MRPIQTTRAFGAAVRHLRKEQGMSQASLAAKSGVGRPWLSELETGKRTAELGRALLVLDALGVAISFVAMPKPDSSSVDLSPRSLTLDPDGSRVGGGPRGTADRRG